MRHLRLIAGLVSAIGLLDAAAAADVAPPVRPFASRPLSVSALAGQRGGDGVALGAQLSGSVSGNSATQVTTGSNTLGGGAFAGTSGIATVIQNTGNNVLIQNAVVVNLQLK